MQHPVLRGVKCLLPAAEHEFARQCHEPEQQEAAECTGGAAHEPLQRLDTLAAEPGGKQGNAYTGHSGQYGEHGQHHHLLPVDAETGQHEGYPRAEQHLGDDVVRAEIPGHSSKEQGAGQLHDAVACGVRALAAGRAPAQHDVADDGQVQIPGDGGLALRAEGAPGFIYAQPAGQAVDDHVQERAHAGSE